MNVEWWLVLASSQKVKGKRHMFDHVCGASSMLKRMALSELLSAMPRKDFKDWTKPLGFEGSGNTHGNSKVEMRQWFSGHHMYAAILKGLTSRAAAKAQQPAGTRKQAKMLFQIRDYTPYDDELLQAVGHLNSNAGSSPVVYAYHAACWHQGSPNARATNQENLISSARDHIRSKIAAGTYSRCILDRTKFGPEPTAANQAAGVKVESKVEDYEFCYPKDSGELPLKATTMALGSSLGSVAILDPVNPDRSWTFDAFVEAHNAEFNPTGLAWSAANPNKRAAADPVVVQSSLTELDSKVELAMDKCGKVVPAAASYQLLIDENGFLYLHALQDAEILEDVKFARVVGTFLVGAAAKAFMGKPGAQFVQYDLNPTSRVLLTQKPPDAPASGPVVADLSLPTSPMSLEGALAVLHAKKQNKVELHKHTIHYTPGATEPTVIKVDEDCCLQVSNYAAASQLAGKEVPLDKLAGAILLENLTKVEILHQLQYDPSVKRLKPMLPALVPAGSGWIVKAGNVYKL